MKLNLYAILFGIGVFLVWYLPCLLPLPVALLVFLVGLTSFKFKKFGSVGVFLLGLSWGIFQSQQAASLQIPDIPSGFDAKVTGVISSLPENRGIAQRFELLVESFEAISETELAETPKHLLLSWYRHDEPLSAGERLDAELRLRRPRGLSNFGQFDYRRWLMGQNIDATGYVRSGRVVGARHSLADLISTWRNLGRSKINGLELQNPQLVTALGFGLKSDIPQEQWDLFVQTGVIHLMVISGLHIGFAASIGFFIGGILCKPLLLGGMLKNETSSRWFASWVFGASYAVLAGLSLPTLRALIMLSLLAATRILRLNWSGWTLLSLAFAVTALVQPRAPLQDSFWLSFGAVLVLVLSLSGRLNRSVLGLLLKTQLVLLVGFGTLLLYLGKPLYLSGLLANLIAVPYTGLMVVPIILLAIILIPGWPWLASALFKVADFALSVLLEFLHWLTRLPIPHFEPIYSSTLPGLFICLSGLLIITLPSNRIRIGFAAVLLPLIFGFSTKQAEFSMLVFDVGQGTSVLIEQPGYRLLYDTGPAFSEQFNAGADILVPHLSKNSGAINTLVVSHDDSDHSGGLPPILESFEIGQFYAGGDKTLAVGAGAGASYCVAGFGWQVGEVKYRFLHPPAQGRPLEDNNQSCVLLIQFAGKAILLAGDIERSVEQALVQNYPDLADIDILLVAHHGSRTSSSESFLQQLHPGIAVISAGYGNSFGHPAKEVVARFESIGSELHSTAISGALRYTWEELDQPMVWHGSRDAFRFWWQE